MKFAFIREKKVAFSVATMCRVLGVSTSGFYDWQKAPGSARAKQDAALAAKIAETHERSRGRYGSPRVHAELRAEGVRKDRPRFHRSRRISRVLRMLSLSAGIGEPPRREGPSPGTDEQRRYAVDLQRERSATSEPVIGIVVASDRLRSESAIGLARNR